jgi:hypothetical protein
VPRTTRKNRKTLTSKGVVPVQYEDGELVPVFPSEVLYLIAWHSPSVGMYRKLRLVSRSCHLNKTDTWSLIKRLTVVKRKIQYVNHPNLLGEERQKRLQEILAEGVGGVFPTPQYITFHTSYLARAHVCDVPMVGGKVFGIKTMYEAHLEPITDQLQEQEELTLTGGERLGLQLAATSGLVLLQTTQYQRNKKHGVELTYATRSNMCQSLGVELGTVIVYSQYTDGKLHGVCLQRHKGIAGPYGSMISHCKSNVWPTNNCIVRAEFENGVCLMVKVYEPKSNLQIPPLPELANCDLEEWGDCVKICPFENGVKHGSWTEVGSDGTVHTFEFKKGQLVTKRAPVSA